MHAHLITGRWALGGGRELHNTSPVDGSLVWNGRFASAEQTEAAIAAGIVAYPDWSRLSLEQRIPYCQRFAEFLSKHQTSIARTITLESGKPLWESQIEMTSAIAKVSNAIDAIHQRRSTTRESFGVVRFRGFGVMLVLGPYNLPLHLPGAHIVPALLGGNTVLFKPSEKAPATGQWIAQAWHEAGLPAGVFQMLQGDAEVATWAVNHPQIAGVLFTGSNAVGKQLHRSLAGRPHVLLALEMGGNNPLIVEHVDNIPAAIAVILQSAFITSGQRCTCARRLILLDSPANARLLQRLCVAIEAIRVSHPMEEPQPFMGTVVSKQAADAILHAQREWIESGARVLHECRPHPENPAMLSPGLLEVDPSFVDDREHFGPLLRVCKANDMEDAIRLANQTQYGLAAGLLSDHPSTFDSMMERIQAGIVNWNAPTTGASGKLPFGGLGESGNHRSSGYYACDYCSDPVASIEMPMLQLPSKLPPGISGLT